MLKLPEGSCVSNIVFWNIVMFYESIKDAATSIHGLDQIAGYRADKFSRCVIRVCESGVSTTS